MSNVSQTPAPHEPLVELTDVVKRYHGRAILDGVSARLGRGEITALIGPSGGGKSTLLRSINGLNTIDGGEIRVGPHRFRPGDAASADTLRAVRRMVGMVFQDFQLFPHLTALGNVAEAPQQVAGKSASEARARARELLGRVGLGERCDHYPSQLSGGQKQRVAIARALAMDPQVLLCDEITSALDPELKHEVLDVLEELRNEGLTLIMVTHEIGFARRAADRVVVLAEGKIVEEGPPEQVIDNPQTERTQRFLKNVLG
ncbi:MAG: amino acid ABC transporter ATP-binding protein [Planctomycetaceae bacterium]|nr:amino acid ABC transporter ATP-binding protein [Planctomycetaceae bacterium]